MTLAIPENATALARRPSAAASKRPAPELEIARIRAATPMITKAKIAPPPRLRTFVTSGMHENRTRPGYALAHRTNSPVGTPIPNRWMPMLFASTIVGAHDGALPPDSGITMKYITR